MTRAPLDHTPIYREPSINWRLIIALFAIEAVTVGAFVWLILEGGRNA